MSNKIFMHGREKCAPFDVWKTKMTLLQVHDVLGDDHDAAFLSVHLVPPVQHSLSHVYYSFSQMVLFQ